MLGRHWRMRVVRRDNAIVIGRCVVAIVRHNALGVQGRWPPALLGRWLVRACMAAAVAAARLRVLTLQLRGEQYAVVSSCPFSEEKKCRHSRKILQ
jgi:hypothetical protein